MGYISISGNFIVNPGQASIDMEMGVELFYYWVVGGQQYDKRLMSHISLDHRDEGNGTVPLPSSL